MDPLRLHSPRTVELTFTSFNQQSCIHNHSEVIIIPSFSGVPRSPYLMLPSWELQGDDQSPLPPVGVGFPDWGPAPGPYLILWPFLVSWSVPPMSLVRARPYRESECWSERKPRIPSGGMPPHLSWGSYALTKPSHQSGGSRGQHSWNFAEASRKCCRNQHLRNEAPLRDGELRFSMPMGPEELTPQALSPEQKGYRVFTHGQA